MHGASKAKITKELENFVKDFEFCTRFFLTSNTYFFGHIVCREKFKDNFLKRQVRFVYTNIYQSPTHEKSISDDSITSLKPTYCPWSLGYSAPILFTTQGGITLLTHLPTLTFYLTLLYCMSTLVYSFLTLNYWYLVKYRKQMK